MKTGPEAYQEHLNRIRRAVALEDPIDRVPVMISADVATARYADPTIKPSDFVTRTDWAYEKTLEGVLKLGKGEIDSVVMMAANPKMKGYIYFAKVKVPGEDLPETALWNIEEVGPMRPEDYDIILNKGYAALCEELRFRRLGYDPDAFMESLCTQIKCTNDYTAAGIVQPFTGCVASTPFEDISAARGMMNFLLDLHRMPDKVKAALDIMFEEQLPQVMGMIEGMKPEFCLMSQIRSGEDFISEKMWEKFVWPHVEKHAHMITEKGFKIIFHNDSKWDARLKYYATLPKKKIIFDIDEMTDIYKAKEILGGTMCITGNVPGALFSIGTPEEVYNYTSRILKDIGPRGFIISNACTIPANSRPENLEAFIEAALGK